jgi:hypothetical protein
LDFIKRLIRAFRDTDWATGSWVAGFMSKLRNDLEVVLKTSLVELKAKNFDWRRPAEELETLLKGADSKTVLLIDELPLLIGSIVHDDPSGNRAERFLLWLKRLREQYQPRWFFCGFCRPGFGGPQAQVIRYDSRPPADRTGRIQHRESQ